MAPIGLTIIEGSSSMSSAVSVSLSTMVCQNLRSSAIRVWVGFSMIAPDVNTG
jgi:hypothetical protein